MLVFAYPIQDGVRRHSTPFRYGFFNFFRSGSFFFHNLIFLIVVASPDEILDLALALALASLRGSLALIKQCFRRHCRPCVRAVP